MKRILFISGFVLIFLLLTSSVNAQMMGIDSYDGSEIYHADDEIHESIDEILPEFLDKYGISVINELDCEAVSDEDFERIGDATMESIHPGEAHEAMDEMMGGEGSESLEAMHINMGKSYLGCLGESSSGFGMMGRNFRAPMMGGSLNNLKGGVAGMMGWNYSGNMMGYQGYNFLEFIIWTVVLIDLVLLGIWLWKQIKKK